MKIVYEDRDQIAVYKPAKVATQTARLGEKDLVSEVKNYIAKESGIANPYAAVINRLDQPVEGIVLFAKNEKAAAALSKQMQNSVMQKYYMAAVFGHLDDKQGQFQDYMEKDTRNNISRIVKETSPNGKKAALSYEVEETMESMQVVKIRLITGRHHQIRLQFSHRGHPLIGDMKYGTQESILLSRECHVQSPALCAFLLKWKHPVTGKDLRVQITPEHFLLQKAGA